TLENHMSNTEAECCDVRWHSCKTQRIGNHNASTKSTDSRFKYYLHHQHHRDHHLHPYHYQHHQSLLSVSAGSRLGNTRLRLCVLVLMLLHTMVSFSVLQNGVTLEPLPGLDDSPPQEE
ncbi:hypothetical protein XELAEV_18042000mg, partial [Xenopus laevis]